VELSLGNLLASIRGGAAVPTVEMADLRAVLKIMTDVKEPHNVGFGAQFIQASCGPEADIPAVWFRASMLHIARKQGLLGSWVSEGEPDDRLLRFWASFPFRATEVLPDDSFKLNTSELEEGLRRLAEEPKG